MMEYLDVVAGIIVCGFLTWVVLNWYTQIKEMKDK